MQATLESFLRLMTLVRPARNALTASSRVGPETLYQGDDALNTKPVMHYQFTTYLCY